MRIKRSKVVFWLIFLGGALVFKGQSQSVEGKNIAFVIEDDSKQINPETKAAFDYLTRTNGSSPILLSTKEIKKAGELLNQYALIWYHQPDSVGISRSLTDSKLVSALQGYVNQGGSLLLTLQAMKLVVPLGLEKRFPKDSLKSVVDEGFGRKLGFHACPDHPIFNGLNGGAYIWRPTSDLKTRVTGYFGEKASVQGKVIAVDWDYIFLRENSKLVLHYRYGKGSILAVGGYMWFSMENLNRTHLERFTYNIVSYLTQPSDSTDVHYWNYGERTITECAEQPQTDQLLVAVASSKPWEQYTNKLQLVNRFASSNYCEVAGEQILLMGKEKGGLEEVWSHPFMALRDYEVGVKFSFKDTVYWLNDQRPEIEILPSQFQRTYKFARAYLTETVVCDPKEPIGAIHYTYKGLFKATLVIRFKSNMRFMWPYSERVTGDMCYQWNSDLGAFVIQEKSLGFNLMLGTNKEVARYLLGHYSGFEYNPATKEWRGLEGKEHAIMGLMEIKLEANDRLDVAFTAKSGDFNLTKSTYSNAINNPKSIQEASYTYNLESLKTSLLITTPDVNFNTGYQWALVGTDHFMVNTPGMGRSLVAGYGTTKRGWDGGHRVNGRPGYTWYFGRDGEWSGMALLDYGDFEGVKSILEFYQKYQDLNGKILHEATTSGVVHYDAADATPLYIVLAGRYFRYSNDTTFLKNSWSFIQKAIDYCFSTDTDQDHLIENTNVGHGWVEGGELYGSHATLYLNACWAEALMEAYTMSSWIKEPKAESYKSEAQNIKKILNTDFWNKDDSFFAYGKNKDGSYRAEQTVLPAVMLDFKLSEKARSPFILQRYASNAFTTNWGVRIVREDSKLFNPRGYHYGSVWPLFTGWTALAEYNYGQYVQGYSHIINNLNGYQNWGLGYIEEVLNGAEYQPSGVCPHQCWSESMVLQPAIEGMLGLNIDAQKNKVFFSPRIPAHWKYMDIDSIRIANQRIGVKYRKTSHLVEYTFASSDPKQVAIEFTPSLPAGTIVKKAKINGKEASLATFNTSQNAFVLSNLELKGTCTLQLEIEKGVEVLPLVTYPKPGDDSPGMRIITTELKKNTYSILLENENSTEGIIEVFTNHQQIDRVEGGRLKDSEDGIYKIAVTFDKGPQRYVQKLVTIYLN